MTTAAPPFGVCVSVPAASAGDALQRLGGEGLRDDRYRVHREDERVLIPVERPARAAELLEGARLVETELEHDPRRPPIEIVRERLDPVLDAEQQAAVPTGWTELGDVLVLRLPDDLHPEAETVARAYADVLDVSSVVHLEGSSGEFREPETRLLCGDEDTETVHREHGIVYRLDPREVMFSPGNKTERHRLRDEVAPGETVVDLFAGIGYFALPLASAGARVIACEANPTAVEFLRENRALNELGEAIAIREGDCREGAPSGVADRVHMGYLPGTDAFLETALDALKPEGGCIHYHDEAPQPDPIEHGRDLINGHEALADVDVEIQGARVVKTMGPGHAHVGLDLEVSP
ncbi:class I SAM-dependent methyltransferase family protein [Thermoplasmatales archaeon SW_10_69_26]|nr:MAG: class I SAM-dependent methyltransferase family protein [Thermoplasmatales archaeon SW_10_69_26]